MDTPTIGPDDKIFTSVKTAISRNFFKIKTIAFNAIVGDDPTGTDAVRRPKSKEGQLTEKLVVLDFVGYPRVDARLWGAACEPQAYSFSEAKA